MERRNRKVVVVLSLIALLFQASCHSKIHKEEEDSFLVTSPLQMDTITTREYVCQIHAVQHIEIRALESGYLEKVYVDEGKLVKKGQIMFQLLPIRYKAEYEKAEAEANYVEIEYENAKILADSSVISPVQLALVKAKLQKAKAELSLASVNLSFAQIRAPFTGLMDRFQVRLGSLLDDGDVLTTMSDISSLWVYFNVPEAEYLNFMQNMKADSVLHVQLRMANHEMFNHDGLVKTIEADFDNTTGNIAFRATFPNPDRLLRHGETGNVIMNIAHKDALIIPQKATYEVLDQIYVFVVDKDGALQPRRVIVDTELPDLYIIKDGLKETDKILLEGLRKVREGDKIKYSFEDPAKVISELKLHAE